MHDTFSWPILLLAAGQSSRMRGADKLLQTVDGLPLIRRQAQVARAATTGPVLVLLPPAPHPRHDALKGLPVDTVAVPDADEGMNASLRRGIAALPSGSGAAMILLADLPDLTADDLRRVFGAVDLAGETRIWRGATADGRAGHPIVVAASLFDGFAALQGDTGGREVIARNAGLLRLVPLPGDRARRDLDTPEDWAAWRAERGAQG
ncbi:MAG: nucleotidyltransferase family protein [Rhodobacteraceae bacterium]|nr:nucleotidyltransferase family protein [Paracoccaceae bacterium]